VREAFLSARSDVLVVSCHVNNSSMSGREDAVQGLKCDLRPPPGTAARLARISKASQISDMVAS
jgi:hypothetical protein